MKKILLSFFIIGFIFLSGYSMASAGIIYKGCYTYSFSNSFYSNSYCSLRKPRISYEVLYDKGVLNLWRWKASGTPYINSSNIVHYDSRLSFMIKNLDFSYPRRPYRYVVNTVLVGSTNRNFRFSRGVVSNKRGYAHNSPVEHNISVDWDYIKGDRIITGAFNNYVKVYIIIYENV